MNPNTTFYSMTIYRIYHLKKELCFADWISASTRFK